MSSRFPEKPLSGADGYKRLARLFARALYFDEMPPKTDDDIEAAPKKSKFAKVRHHLYCTVVSPIFSS